MKGKLFLRYSQALIHTLKLPLQLLGQGSCSQHRSLPSRQHSQSSPQAEGEVGARAAGLGEGRVVSDAMGAVGGGHRMQWDRVCWRFPLGGWFWSESSSSASLLALLLHRPSWLPQTWQNRACLQPSATHTSLVASCSVLFLLTFIKKMKYLLLRYVQVLGAS